MTIRIAALLAPLLLFGACNEGSATADGTPFSGAQLDRIETALRARGAGGAAEPRGRAAPLWVSSAVLDDRSRLVLHIRLAVSGDLDDLARHEASCARTRARIEQHLLPGQQVELYLVFDGSVHACRGLETG